MENPYFQFARHQTHNPAEGGGWRKLDARAVGDEQIDDTKHRALTGILLLSSLGCKPP